MHKRGAQLRALRGPGIPGRRDPYGDGSHGARAWGTDGARVKICGLCGRDRCTGGRAGQVTLKDLHSGEQKTLDPAAAIAEVKVHGAR